MNRRRKRGKRKGRRRRRAVKLLAAQSEVSCFQPLTPGKNFDNNTQHVISSHPHDEEERRADGDGYDVILKSCLK